MVDILQVTFSYAFCSIEKKKKNLFHITAKLVPVYPMDKKSALTQVKAWCQAITWTNDDQVLRHNIASMN